MPGTLLAISLAATLIAPLSGCVVIRSDSPPPKWLSSLVPSSSAEATVTQTTSGAKKASGTTIYLARKGRLVAVTRASSGKATVENATELLLAGPTAEERKAGLGSAVPAGTTLLAVSLDYGGHANLDLSRAFAAGEADRALRLAQVVFTLTEIPGVDGVIVTIDGKRVERFGPMKDLIRPQKRADYREFSP